MQSLIAEIHDDLHIVHKSIFVMLFKGGVAWLVVTIIFIIATQIMAKGWYFFQNSQSGIVAVTPTVTQDVFPTFIFPIILLFFSGLLILYIILSWIYEYYVIQSTGIIIRKGIVFTEEDDFSIEAIQSIGVTQGLLGRIFNFGTVWFFNPVLKEDIYLSNITDPYNEARFIQKLHPTAQIVHFLPSRHSNVQHRV